MSPSERPQTGTYVAFSAHASQSLAGIPARVCAVVERMQSGDWLVTLEYAQPVLLRRVWCVHVDAFWSELEPVQAVEVAR